MAGLRLEGLTAPAVFNGPIDNVSFVAYVEHVLTSTLRAGDVVVLDNLAVHKQPDVFQMCQLRPQLRVPSQAAPAGPAPFNVALGPG